MEMRCEECDHVWKDEVEQAFIDSRVFCDKDDPRDGLLLCKVIRCPACGVEDRYALEGRSHGSLTLHILMAVAGEEGSRVLHGVPTLWDGTIIRRASHGIARLREWCEREPENGEAWRRLGNFLERFGQEGEAIQAWRQAVEVDESEAEAAFSLAKAGADALDWGEFEHWLQMYLHRLPGVSVLRRSDCAAGAAQLLERASWPGCPPRALEAVWSAGTTGSGEPVVCLSGLSLAGIRDWSAVEHFLARVELLALRLTSELPVDDNDTLLARELGFAPVRRPRVQRDATARSRSKRKKARKRARTSRRRNR